MVKIKDLLLRCITWSLSSRLPKKPDISPILIDTFCTKETSHLCTKTALFRYYIIHFHALDEDVRCAKSRSASCRWGRISRRCDTGARESVRRLRDSLTPGRADPQSGGESTQEEPATQRSRKLQRKKRCGKVFLSSHIYK